MKLIHTLRLSVLLFALAGCASSPQIQMGPEARTADGLQSVTNTVMDEVWFRPDADMTKYTKIMIVNAGFQFSGESDSAARNAKFEEIVVKEFTSGLKELRGFEIVEEAGDDVLLMYGAIRNVELLEDMSGPGKRIFLRELGSADLIIDLRDSLSGEAIIVATDHGVLDSAGKQMREATDQEVWSSTRRLAQGWATLLRERLDQLAQYRLGGS